MKLKLYILETETRAKFDNLADATAYYKTLKEDEPHAYVREPVRKADEGLYVVLMSKAEDIQTSRL